MMDYFPFFFDLSKIQCLLVGEGQEALNKITLLSKANAHIRVVSCCQETPWKKTQTNHDFTLIERPIIETDIEQSDLIIVATKNENLKQQLCLMAAKHRKFINVVDDKEKCNFIFPSIVDRGELTIAIGTSGVAPTVSSWLRSHLELAIPKSWTQFMQSLKQMQPDIRNSLPDNRLRRRFYHQLIQDFLPKSSTNTVDGMKSHITDQLKASSNRSHKNQTTGKVYLVGAGPGNSELISMRAHQLLAQADIVLYDRLVSHSILDYARRDAEKIYVGKQTGEAHSQQKKINQLLVKYAKKGNIVLRLKGGDPLLFARVSEEMQALQENNIAFEIVPGISAVHGIAASLGIPLTMRGVSNKLLMTSVYMEQKDPVNWKQLAQPKQTLVLYMGLKNLNTIVQQLIAHQLSTETPIAIVEKGTCPKQKVIYSTIGNIGAHSDVLLMESPVLIIIGEVILYRSQSA